MKTKTPYWLAGLVLLAFGLQASADEAEEIYPSAIFEFAERGAGVEGYGAKVSDILFATLSADPNLYLVDRTDMNKLLQEHELNLSGMVAPGQAVKVGQLTGARIILTGSVIEADKSLYLVGKIIGTETSRVFGVSVKGRTSDELGPLVEQLASQIAESFEEKADDLIAKVPSRQDRLAKLKKELRKAERPVVAVRIDERHIGQATVDPAAQTEIALFCKETGFEIVDTDLSSSKQADIIIQGEGFSEFAARRGNLVTVKARLEVKAIDQRTGKVIAIDRQTAIEVDISEHIAGKKALQEAAASIAERLLPAVVGKR